MGLYPRLKFPQRAENLKQFSSYQVELKHWAPLAAPFRDRFEAIYERGEAAILLVHGKQGCGKTLFCDRLEADFSRASKGAYRPDSENLWHNLVGGSPAQADTIRDATTGTTFRRVLPDVGWLAAEQTQARADTRFKVRVILIDDAHLDVFLCELAGVDLSWFRVQPSKENAELAVTRSAADRLVQLSRKDFQRSLFVFASNRFQLFNELHQQIEQSHRGLSLLQELPLPEPQTKERIVRTNTNRLNNVSYWYCLNTAGPEEKKRVYQVLGEQEGFTDSFLALDDALKSGGRAGRPANKNTITLVTLGAALHDVQSFIQKNFNASASYFGQHLAAWQLEEWASLLTNGDAEQARRAELTESEFSLQWISLDPAAVVTLCQRVTMGDIGQSLMANSLMSSKSNLLANLPAQDQQIPELSTPDAQQWWDRFVQLVQRRSTLYEPSLAERATWAGKAYGVAFQNLTVPEVRPDLIVAPYIPCAVTSAVDATGINTAIRRSCHTLEFTAFLGHQLKGLEEYILEKATRYALLLESV